MRERSGARERWSTHTKIVFRYDYNHSDAAKLLKIMHYLFILMKIFPLFFLTVLSSRVRTVLISS